MKLVITGITFWACTTFCFSQTCERNGSFTGGTVNGTVKIKAAKNGKMFIQFGGDFKTTDGPDLNIYLSNTAIVNNDSKLVHSLDALEASQKYKLTNPVNIDSYQYIIIHCTKYNHHFGSATLNNKQGDGCPVDNE